ncbi:MAG: flavodoxin family protein [Planctomycetota bacterium]
MTLVAIVYHSGFGHTRKQAEAVAEGVWSAGADAAMHAVEEFPAPENNQYAGPWDVLARADAIVFGCPTYMGTISAGLKRFMDDSSVVWFQQGWKDKLAGGFTNSSGLSGDKLNTLVSLVVFAAQHGMNWVTLGMMPPSDDAGQTPDTPNRMGGFLGAFAQSGNVSPEEAPPPGDLETARHYGSRIASLAARMADS